MAEKYGVIPKRFTREWWEYFWMYYKWRTIIIVFIVLSLSITITQCVTREKFDLTVSYMGLSGFRQETLEKAEEICERYAYDADKNGQVNVFFQQMNTSNTPGSAEMDYALQTKHDVELSNEGSLVFIYDEEESKNQLGRKMASEIYLDVNQWADMEIPDERLIKAQDGTPIAVKLKPESVLSESGIKTEGMAVCIRQNVGDKEFDNLSMQGAVKLVNELIK